jgi:MoxR-like ATPase
LPGPLFAHFLLGDEFNRASERTRAPLLEAMEEGRVTIDGKSYILPQPYMVLATVNPTDVEGVYRIGAAQSDRFMMKVHTSSEKESEAFEIVRNRLQRKSLDIESVVTRERIISAQEFVEENIHVSDELVRRVIKIIFKAREEFKSDDTSDKTRYGPSGKRPYLQLVAASQAMAFIRGKEEVTPDIIDYLTLPVLRHRISLGYIDSDHDVDVQIEDILKEVSHEIAGIQY